MIESEKGPPGWGRCRSKTPQLLAAILLGTALFFAGGTAWALYGVRYVDVTNSTPGDGTSWSTAYTRIQDAINDRKCSEIRVRGFDRIPTPTYEKFVVHKPIAIYGGYAVGNNLPPKCSFHPFVPCRDPQTYRSIIQGSSRCALFTNDAVMDGFVIQGGNVLADLVNRNGGGILVESSTLGTTYPHVTISNCYITNNTALNGGGLFVSDGIATVERCTFYGNSAIFQSSVTSGFGGGVAVSQGVAALASSVELRNCLFLNNTAQFGGGVVSLPSTAIPTSSLITNCAFAGNSVTSPGGGAAVAIPYWGTSSITGCTFTGNTAPTNSGPAIMVGTSSKLLLRNSVLWDSSTPEIYFFSPAGTRVVDIINSDIKGYASLPASSFSDGGGNIDQDPGFAAAPINPWLTASPGNFALGTGSPCIDVGKSFDAFPVAAAESIVRAQYPFDLAGNPRITDGNADGISIVDMGAYEYQYVAPPVDTDGDGIPDDGDGSGTAGDFPCIAGNILNCDDNCPDVANPDQADVNGDGIGDVCDTTAVSEQLSDKPAITSATPTSSPEGRIYIDATVTLNAFDWDGDGNADDTWYVRPDPYNVIVRLYDCEIPAHELIATQINCGSPCSVLSAAQGGDLITVPANQTPAVYHVLFDLSAWFPNLASGCYQGTVNYVNYCSDPLQNPLDSCPDPEPCYNHIWLGVSEVQGTFTFTTSSTGTDQCLDVPGDAGGTGCPYADKNIVTLHTVNLGKGPATQIPLEGATVRVFDRSSPDFLAVAGRSNPDGSLYPAIFLANEGRVAGCVTDANGVCYAGETQKGDYLVIVQFYDPVTHKTVYVGRPKGPADFDSSGIATKEFQIMKVLKNGVFQEYRGGSKFAVTGSLLEVIAPETAVWEGTSSIYPFIFKSDSDWTVDVCASVPSGYSILGVYDESGNLIPSAQCLETFVNGETKTVAFEVADVGSPEPSLNATLTMKSPKGKKTVKTIVASDIRGKSLKAKIAKIKEAKHAR